MLRSFISGLIVLMTLAILGGPIVANADLGGSAADLVYTPVTPCRIIDTRLAGGPIAAGANRDFLVSGTQNFETQGGNSGGCGIPEGATAAMLNFVAVLPSGSGFLRAWPFGQPVPSSSIINYGAVPGLLALANGAVVPLCNPATTTCTFDLSVRADQNATDLVVDVMGFLQSTAPRGSFGAGNTFLGVNAGNFTMTGGVNTATGAQALRNNTNGGSNTATGFAALEGNSTGGANTAIGFNALRGGGVGSHTGNMNTATGSRALENNRSGDSNTATGQGSLFNNFSGASNTAIGLNSLFTNSTGNNNTALGSGADVASSNLSNATGIGNGAVVNASTKVRVGNTAVTVIEGQVGFTSSSDVTKKENFRAVDGDDVLRKLRELTLSSWNFIGQDASQFRHYGPSAQEFFADFGHDGIGTIGTPTTITSTDLDGILMIAVQALERRTAELAHRRARLEALERLLGGHASVNVSTAPSLRADQVIE